MSTNGEEGAAASNTETANTPEDLKAALEEARQKAAENWDLFLRAQADFQNLQRRSRLDVENAHKYGFDRFGRDMLLVVDSLDHGLTHAKPNESDQALHQGMELTFKMLLDTLEKYGIHQINPIGEAFDPAKHEAISTQINDEVEPNQVLVVVQKGFTLHDRLLRPARVIVSRKTEA